jgi:transcriptional regulator with XRE-family HTH domain
MNGGLVIKKLLRDAGIKQSDFAVKTNQARETFNRRLSSGDIDDSIINAVSDATGIEVQEIRLQLKEASVNVRELIRQNEKLEAREASYLKIIEGLQKDKEELEKNLKIAIEELEKLKGKL